MESAPAWDDRTKLLEFLNNCANTGRLETGWHNVSTHFKRDCAGKHVICTRFCPVLELKLSIISPRNDVYKGMFLPTYMLETRRLRKKLNEVWTGIEWNADLITYHCLRFRVVYKNKRTYKQKIFHFMYLFQMHSSQCSHNVVFFTNYELLSFVSSLFDVRTNFQT